MFSYSFLFLLLLFQCFYLASGNGLSYCMNKRLFPTVPDPEQAAAEYRLYQNCMLSLHPDITSEQISAFQDQMIFARGFCVPACVEHMRTACGRTVAVHACEVMHTYARDLSSLPHDDDSMKMLASIRGGGMDELRAHCEGLLVTFRARGPESHETSFGLDTLFHMYISQKLLVQDGKCYWLSDDPWLPEPRTDAKTIARRCLATITHGMKSGLADENKRRKVSPYYLCVCSSVCVWRVCLRVYCVSVCLWC